MAIAWLNDNKAGTVTASLAAFSRGDAAAAIFSQILYDQGEIDPSTLRVLVPPGQIKVTGGVLFDPVTTGSSGNLSYAPIDSDFVAMDALNDYRNQFESTRYANQSNIIRTFNFTELTVILVEAIQLLRLQLQRDRDADVSSGNYLLTRI